jgi:hypothetical protein
MIMVRIEGEALIHSVALLVKNLRFAGRLFDKSAADQGRVSVILSLSAITEFLRSVGGPEDAVMYVPLHQLQYGLHDLEARKVPDLLKPTPIERRPPDSASDTGFRAFAAVAMDLLMDGDVPREEAARRVARELTAMGYMASATKTITAQRVEDWRDRVREERPAEYAPAGRFHRLKQELMRRFPQDHVAAAEFLLHRLPMTVPSRNPNNPAS